MKSSISNTDSRLLSSLFVLVLLFLFNSTAVKLMTLYVNQFLTFNSPRCCFNPAKPVVGRSCSPSYGPVRVLKLEFLRTILERTGAMSCQSQRLCACVQRSLLTPPNERGLAARARTTSTRTRLSFQ